MNWFSKAKVFFKEVNAEWKKVSFPSRDEVVGTTIVVLIASVIIALYLWVADILILRLYSLVLGVFG
jgi:preprotein translocase subunit SecE